MSPLTIGKLAKQTEVTIETIRHYQRIGLLTEPAKPDGGYRVYSADAIARIRFIKRAQQAGFTLKEIATLLSLDGARCADVRQVAEQKCRQIDQQIKDLTALRQALGTLVNDCQQTASSARCAILDAFSDDASTKP
ncbi:MerR family transcriptional regulator [Methylomonas sp. BW4-1]|jgi:MerR family mercuric resistance operon transcriptional regulator|uniref:MerR family transcriptional regulator n=1 Tax=unclassified Methylomonas TaxID=2608980 RepID=UPI001AC213EB|nr:Mercuric resistance operon regulatory protein [Methylococcales bacterium]